MRRSVQIYVAILLSSTLANFSAFAQNDGAKEKAEAATAVIEFGASIGKVLWTGVNPEFHPISQPETDEYRRLALSIKQRIETGRAASSLVRANFDVIGTTLAYVAVTDPEPMTKTVAALASWGAKKTGDLLAQSVLDQASTQARSVLARAIKDSSLSPEELEMSCCRFDGHEVRLT